MHFFPSTKQTLIQINYEKINDLFVNIYGSIKIFMIVFAIICKKSNYNYSKILIANKIDKTDIKFSLIDTLKGYNIDNKLNKK